MIKRYFPIKASFKGYKNFCEFNKNIKFSKEVIGPNTINNKIGKKYEKIIIGSDQVWNYNFDRFSENRFALFSPSEKVISYAASFGISEIPENEDSIFVRGLNNISKISVREDKGAEIVKKLIKKDAQVVLDPTLLLDKQEWKKVMKKPKKVLCKKYILTYFLGDVSEERKREIKNLANNNNFEIVNLGKIEFPLYYTAGPSEFLWYFSNAEIIFTDSFHACVFSIIFDKTFYSMNRDDKSVSMNSRIETLLTKIELKDRKFENWKNVSLNHDYSHVKKILENEKKKSISFLRNALGIKE